MLNLFSYFYLPIFRSFAMGVVYLELVQDLAQVMAGALLPTV